MKILVSGASGLVGSALCQRLEHGGVQVHRLVRHAPARAHELIWDPESGVADPVQLEGFDAVVHLAGESIAAGRWTRARKDRIRSSRVVGTRGLAEALARVTRKPLAFLCASAVGWYGNRGDERLDETSSPGSGFLAQTCREWEAACEPLAQVGVRVANMRFGMILAPGGGALSKMLLPFRMGVGGRLGSGAQWMSWIALDDVLGGIEHLLAKPDVGGPVAFTAPNPVTNADFTRVLARVLRRPAILPAPAIALRLVLGEMADELLLASQRVTPAVLQQAGYTFAHPELESALRHVLRSTAT